MTIIQVGKIPDGQVAMKNQMNKRNNQRGAAAVEFALILPVLLLILFGVIEFGLVMFNKQVITNASREGARFGIVSDTPRKTVGQITGEVTRYTDKNLITFSKISTPLVVSVPSPCVSFGNDLTVNVTYRYDFLVLSALTRLFEGGLGDGVNLQARTVMRCE